MPDTLTLRAPHKLEDLGVPSSLIQDLVLRRALFEGRTSTLQLANSLNLSVALMSKVIEDLRDLRHIEVLGLDGYDYTLELTLQGRDQAADRMTLCRYAGAAPVSLRDYVAVINQQSQRPVVSLESMHKAFEDLVINDRLLDELGPALLTEGAMFLYGPPGTGKTSLAERLIRVHEDPVLVPYAVEVDSQIITVFDPVIHVPLAEQPADLDSRWVLCRRPSIVVGGELQASMMDLTYEPTSGIYLAPVQMQANNGILVIDDFGRQTMTPEELLNRWIVPLDRRKDYLSLSYGVRFEIPFDVKVVFSTNLEPASLGDEAFFRRIQNKILVPSIDDHEFDEVLTRSAARYGVTITPGAPEYLRTVSRHRGDGDLRPYLPNEVCKIVSAICEYEHKSRILDTDTVDRVAAIYFTQSAAALAKAQTAAHEAAVVAGTDTNGTDTNRNTTPSPESAAAPEPVTTSEPVATPPEPTATPSGSIFSQTF